MTRSSHEQESRSRSKAHIGTVRARGRLKAWGYVRRDARGFESSVLCKLCGATIQSLVTVETKTEKRGNRTVIREKQVMAQTAAYQEVRLVMSDGSAHVTPLCKPCAGTLSPADYEDIYAADLDEFLALEKSGSRAPWRILEGRVAISHELVED